jgi:DNA-directed RNA polymerase subunit E'/Rpb7
MRVPTDWLSAETDSEAGKLGVRRESMTAVILQQVEEQYLNVCLRELGLCIAIISLGSRGPLEITPGDSSPCVKVHFRALFFLPHQGELLLLTPTHVSAEGIQFRLGNVCSRLTMSDEDKDKDMYFRAKYSASGAKPLPAYLNKVEDETFALNTDTRVALVLVKGVHFFEDDNAKVGMQVDVQMRGGSLVGDASWFFDAEYDDWHDSAVSELIDKAVPVYKKPKKDGKRMPVET